MPNLDKQTIELAFVAVAALALLIQTIFMVVLVATLRKAASSAREDIADLRSAIMPIIDETRKVVTRVAPKVEATADELNGLVRSLRAQTADVQAAAAEVIGRVQRISGRLDAMASTVLDGAEHAAGFVSDTVGKSARQVSGVLASIKAVVESLRTDDYQTRGRAPMGRPTVDPRSADKDMFV